MRLANNLDHISRRSDMLHIVLCLILLELVLLILQGLFGVIRDRVGTVGTLGHGPAGLVSLSYFSASSSVGSVSESLRRESEVMMDWSLL
jgi:hypothetical protein